MTCRHSRWPVAVTVFSSPCKFLGQPIFATKEEVQDTEMPCGQTARLPGGCCSQLATRCTAIHGRILVSSKICQLVARSHWKRSLKLARSTILQRCAGIMAQDPAQSLHVEAPPLEKHIANKCLSYD